MSKKIHTSVTILFVSVAIITLPGCISESPEEVVVYCALDKEFSDPIFRQFAAETGIKVLPKFDQESNKTVGLANEIIQQRNRQRCDVFWNNEILHTLRLKQLGMLTTYDSPQRSKYPEAFGSSDRDWYGFAARARVFVVNTELLPDRNQWPNSIDDLIDKKWTGKCAIAKPFFGTTATHAAVLYSRLGNEAADQFFRKVSSTVEMEGGNKQVAINVARGKYAFGLTDTDDAIIEIEQGGPVAIVFPDQDDDQPGTLIIPNTLCIVQNGPNRTHAKKLVDFLLRNEIETKLAKGPSAQIPLRLDRQLESRIEPDKLKIMQADFESAAKDWDSTKERLKKIFAF